MVTAAEVEAKDFVGSSVSTPAGDAVVVEATERYVKVKLGDGSPAEFGHREVTLLPKAAPAPAPEAPPTPPVEPPVTENPAQ